MRSIIGAEGADVGKLLMSGAILLLGGVMVLVFSLFPFKQGNGMAPTGGDRIALPEPRYESASSLEATLAERRSVRTFRDEPLSLTETAQLLWAAQGITDRARGLRTAPSAGALYPMEVFLVVRKADGLSPGVYRYLPGSHELESVRAGDLSGALAEAALGQSSIREAPAAIVLAGVYARTRGRYGDRTERYVHMEAGHVGQNIALQAAALGLSSVMMGAFQDLEVARVVGMSTGEAPLYIIPVGK